MLDVGSAVPEARVWTGPNESCALSDLVAHRPALYLFYLFDWSST